MIITPGYCQFTKMLRDFCYDARHNLFEFMRRFIVVHVPTNRALFAHMHQRGERGIALRETDRSGRYRFMSLDTGRVIQSHSWQELLIDDFVISFFNLHAFILLTSTIVPGINYFVVITHPLHQLQVR